MDNRISTIVGKIVGQEGHDVGRQRNIPYDESPGVGGESRTLTAPGRSDASGRDSEHVTGIG